jgi:hypothetical protein
MSAVEVISTAQPIGGITEPPPTVDLKDVSLADSQYRNLDNAMSSASLAQMVRHLTREGPNQSSLPEKKCEVLAAQVPGALPPTAEFKSSYQSQTAKGDNGSPRQTRSIDKVKRTSTAQETLKTPTKSPRESRKKAVKTRDSSQDSEMDPREVSLERNRVAACKSRIRKKRWTGNLEEKKQRLEAMHGELQAQYVGLLQESSQLKDFLISHASCHEPNIDIWIQHEVSKYIGKLANQGHHQPGSIQSSSNTQGKHTMKQLLTSSR